MRHFAILLLASVLVIPAYSQSEEMVKQVQPVTIKKDTYEQSFSSDANNACLVRFTVYNTKKGEETVYEFNAADLNPKTITFDTRKNEVMVEATTDRKRDLIRVYEDGVTEGYQNDVTILALGIQEARDLVSAWKEMVQQCQQQTAQTDMEGKSAAELLSFLEKSMGTIDQDDIQYDQSITHRTDKSAIITYQQINTQDGEDLQYTVNLADLDERSISFDTKGALVLVTAETQGGQNLVQVTENGQPENYQDEITLIATDIEQARLLEQAWRQLVSLTEDETEFISGNADPTVDATLDFLKKSVGVANTYEQSFWFDQNTRNGGGYLFNYQSISTDEGKEESYRWNVADVKPSNIELSVQKSNVFVAMTTADKSDLIAYSENGVLDNYTDKVAIRASTIEEARKLMYAFRHVTEKISDQSGKLELPATISATVNFLQQRVGNIANGDEKLAQSLEMQPDGPCTLVYRVVDEEDGDELIYEWGMSDLNEKSISLGTKGNTVFVEMETVGKRELIEVVENGEIDDYEKQVKIQAAGIEEAREIVTALQHLTGLCKEQ
ncbi:MAG: hypothetical protein AAF944_03160 [Bacteroidota bacterium]